MKSFFNNIKEFSQLKKDCIFCQKELVCKITSFYEKPINGRNLNELNSFLNGDTFEFDIKYQSISRGINVRATVNAETCEISFENNNNSIVVNPIEDHNEISRIFQNNFNPFVGLMCENKRCKSKYYISTNSLKIEDLKIKPLVLYGECFNIDNLWIMNFNSFYQDKTCIYPVGKSEALRVSDSLQLPRMDFESLGKDKLINKIKTLVTFS